MAKNYMLIIFLVWISVSNAIGNVVTFSNSDDIPYIPEQVLDSLIEEDRRFNQQKTMDRMKGMLGIIPTVEVSMILPVKNSILGKEMDSIREEIAKIYIESLSEAGVPVVSYSDWKENEFKPVLKVFLSFSDTTFIMWLYCEDQFILQRKPEAYKYQTIWEESNFISCPTILIDETAESRKVICEEAKKLLDNFIQLYKKANTTQMETNPAQSPTAEEQKKISQYISDSPVDELEGLTCFFPVTEIRMGPGTLNPVSHKSFAINEKIINRYLMILQNNNIPITPLEVWEEDPCKTYMKIGLHMGQGAVFVASLYDRYILKRSPEEIEYIYTWSYSQSLEDEKLTKAKQMRFFLSQSDIAFKDFVKAYRAANLLEEDN